MKQAILPILAILLCVGSYAQEAKVKAETASGKKTKMKQEGDQMKMKGDMAMQQVDLPYTATYSSQFVMGNPAHAKMVLDMYKAYEDNNFSGDNRFSDTATFILPDGQVLKGSDAIMNALTQGRSAVSNAAFTISAVMPVHSVDKNTDWVLVWGRQPFHSADGSSGQSEFQSIWQVNKDQKIDFVQIYEGKTPAQ